MKMKISRNDKCWCGSGKKYKTCHLKFDEKLKTIDFSDKLIPPHKMIKNKEQIEGIRIASEVNTRLLDHLEAHIKAGMSTEDIDVLTNEFLAENNAEAADLGYMGYPKSICTSVNDVVCHGIPSKDVILKDGDIINVDATTRVNGYYGDASRMYMIGEVDPKTQQLVKDTKEALKIGMATVKPFESTFGDIGAAIEKFAHSKGYSIVREFTGHGVGLELHEEPYVFHFKPNEKTHLIVPEWSLQSNLC